MKHISLGDMYPSQIGQGYVSPESHIKQIKQASQGGLSGPENGSLTDLPGEAEENPEQKDTEGKIRHKVCERGGGP